ncbi:MAG: hypothetical protein KBT19_00600 [Lachnospiraceae bacterium]|nr:hypothetical protein [Candidatus Colinaster equi]
MKKICRICRILLVTLLCLVLAGCDTSYAIDEYNMDSKIASRSDHCSIMASKKSVFSFSSSFKAKQFAGNTTIYHCAVTKEGLTNITCSLSLEKGVAKLVYVDNYDTVTTLVECTPDTPAVSVVVPVNVELGKCRIKLVGYDCENVAAEVELEN